MFKENCDKYYKNIENVRNLPANAEFKLTQIQIMPYGVNKKTNNYKERKRAFNSFVF